MESLHILVRVYSTLPMIASQVFPNGYLVAHTTPIKLNSSIKRIQTTNTSSKYI